METIDINHKYEALFKSLKRYIILYSGRGGGKSFVITLYLISKMLENNNNILFCRWTMVSAKISIIPVFEEMMEMMGVSHLFKVNKTDITCITTGSVIYFRGIKSSSNAELSRLKSLNCNFFVLEECFDLRDEAIFNTINLSIRAKNKENKVILVGNPEGLNHWIYKRWFKQGNDNDTEYIKVNYIDNLDNLHESFIDEANKLKEKNYELYEHLFLGVFYNNKENLIFPNFRIGKQEEFDDLIIPYGIGLDFGWTDKCASTKVWIDDVKKVIYIEELFYASGMTNEMILQQYNNLIQISQNIDPVYNSKIRADVKLNRRIVKNGDTVICDAAEPKSINYLKQNKINAVPVKKPKIIERIKFAQEYEIVINPTSYNLINEMNEYRFIEGSEIPDSKCEDHLIDSWQYYFSWFKRL